VSRTLPPEYSRAVLVGTPIRLPLEGGFIVLGTASPLTYHSILFRERSQVFDARTSSARILCQTSGRMKLVILLIGRNSQVARISCGFCPKWAKPPLSPAARWIRVMREANSALQGKLGCFDVSHRDFHQPAEFLTPFCRNGFFWC
jgi:hypothetical protein